MHTTCACGFKLLANFGILRLAGLRLAHKCVSGLLNLLVQLLLRRRDPFVYCGYVLFEGIEPCVCIWVLARPKRLEPPSPPHGC